MIFLGSLRRNFSYSFKSSISFSFSHILAMSVSASCSKLYSPSSSCVILLFGMSIRMASEETGWKPVCQDRRGRLSSQVMITLSIFHLFSAQERIRSEQGKNHGFETTTTLYISGFSVKEGFRKSKPHSWCFGHPAVRWQECALISPAPS